MPAGDLEGVDRLIGGWGTITVDGQAGIDLLDIERITIMGNDDIGFVEDSIQLGSELAIVVLIGLIPFVIRQGISLDALFSRPENPKAEQERVPLYPDGVGFVEGPDVGEDRSGFNVNVSDLHLSRWYMTQ